MVSGTWVFHRNRRTNVTTYFSISGKIVSFRMRRRSGAISARKGSAPGWVVMNSSKDGMAVLKEFTAVKDEMKAVGMDQNIQSAADAPILNASPVRRAWCGIPTFLQKISFGSGASCTNMVVG
jgi:hypothetical protein